MIYSNVEASKYLVQKQERKMSLSTIQAQNFKGLHK